jgi:DNA helicase-2/ATP-dependent DNA helicase PcrA
VNPQDPEWKEEQRRVDYVTEKINGAIHRLEQDNQQIKSQVVEFRKHFWDDVTVNIDTFDDLLETYFAVKQQAEVLAERERSHSQASRRLLQLQRLAQSPYFGRIDFREEGQPEAEPIYIGISSFLDEESDEYLIYDWRAPISSVYYDYPPGPASYETPGGRIDGELSLKRQYRIWDGKLRYMFDTGLTIGDELLQQVLSHTADVHMRNIVATIQKEQNQIIRNDSSRLLIVQGAAGSGKTSAALQRVAYLLYKYRDSLDAEQMILFSPNPLFNSYVSTVLPELGENNMQQTTFQEYLVHRLGETFQLEDPFDQLEYVLASADHPDYEARLAAIAYKSSADYMNVLRQYKVWLEREGMRFHDIRFRDRVLFSAEQLSRQFYSFDPSIRLTNRLLLLNDWLLEQLVQLEKQEVKEPWVEEEIELLSQEEYRKAFRLLQKKRGNRKVSFDDFQKETLYLSRYVVHRRFKPIREQIKTLRYVDVTAVYRQLWTDPALFRQVAEGGVIPEPWDAISRITAERMDRMELAYEDAAPFLFMKELIEGSQVNMNIRHVIVDEAQDYSPFQFAFLKKLFPRSRMTVLGDLNQSIYAQTSALQDQLSLSNLYGEEETERIRLTRSYRSTREIVEFTRHLLPNGDEIIPFNRSGELPVVTAADNLAELNARIAALIHSLQSEGFESIAVLCKTAGETDQAYEMLQPLVKSEIHRITKHTPKFRRGISVIPSYLAKGVEFDAVILYNASKSQYSREQERKLFYTACTRAMHRLYLFYTGEMSPFLAQVPAETYVKH